MEIHIKNLPAIHNAFQSLLFPPEASVTGQGADGWQDEDTEGAGDGG